MSCLVTKHMIRATVSTLQPYGLTCLRPHLARFGRLETTTASKRNVSQASKSSPSASNLPHLPVPPLQQTLEKYLKSVKPLVTANEYRNTENLVLEFGNAGGIGEKLQKLLEKKAKESENWLSDWWLHNAYLAYRSPVIVYSSPGLVMPRQRFESLDDRLRCASKVIHGALDYKRIVDCGELPQEMMGKAPLDMKQHGMIFGTCRIPGENVDELIFAPNAESDQSPKHIVVVHNNNFFKVNVYDDHGNVLDEDTLHMLLNDVVQRSVKRGPAVGLLTTENRNVWEKVYKQLRQSSKNKKTLSDIQKSLFVVCIDGPNKTSGLNYQTTAASQMIHGGGDDVNSGNRWFDKTVQFIIGATGEVGLCYEHSPAEGPPIANISDHVTDFMSGKLTMKVSSDVTVKQPAPELLEFEISDAVSTAIEEAKKNLDILVRDLDMSCSTFSTFGKNFIKSQKLSPDSFIQAAMQFAFYRMHNELGATYETASTRQFLHGRTETIRSATPEALDMCKTMSNDGASFDEKKKSIQRAVGAHKDYVVDAIRGFGVDRHLMGLKLVAVENGYNVPEIYLDGGFIRSSHFRLSTSQVPARYGSFMCYGPSVPDGYGCCYNPRDNDMLFGISAFNSCVETSASKYNKALADSLNDMHNALLAAQSSKL